MIDTSTPFTAGWWANKGMLALSSEFSRVNDLIKRSEGDGPLPHGANENLYQAYCAFQRKARSNWADLIVRAREERVRLVGFATSVEAGDDGDNVALSLAERSGLLGALPDATRFALITGSGPMIVGRHDGETLVTAEDPRLMTVFRDPANQRIRAAFKVLSDPDVGRQYAYLYWSGPDGEVRCNVAYRDVAIGTAFYPVFTSAWDWHPDYGGEAGQILPVRQVPVVELRSRHGVGVFEQHTDLLDRITHETLQSLVIVAMQAYKQRATIGLPLEDEEGNLIDYDGLFEGGPGALWNLPEGVDVKEFSEADIRSVLELRKDSRRELAELTATPLRSSISDSANQTAEGAAYSREQLVFSVDEFLHLASSPVASALSLVAQWEGDEQRSNPTSIAPKWMDPARRSLAEMGDVDSKAQRTLPLVERLIKIWQYSPSEAARIAAEKRREELDLQAMALFSGVGGASARTVTSVDAVGDIESVDS